MWGREAKQEWELALKSIMKNVFVTNEQLLSVVFFFILLSMLSWNSTLVDAGGLLALNLPKHTKDPPTFQCGGRKKKKQPLKLALKCFPKTAEKKQMRDVKAKPAVSTLKTVHTNYFLEGVSTLFPLCCQHSHRLDCRRAFSLPLPGNAQHPISIFIHSQSIIPPLSSI